MRAGVLPGAGAAAAVALLLSGCTLAGPRPGGPDAPAAPGGVVAPAAGGPDVRVGLVVGADSLRIGGTGELELMDDGGQVHARSDAGVAWTIRRDGGGMEASSGAQRVRVPGSLIVRPRGAGMVTANEKRFRGSLLVRPAERGVTAVNVLDMETYLLGVVPLEIGKNRPPEELEAVKAQAIAARTYAIRHMGRREALGFDIYGTVSDQVYGGADAEDAVASRAVQGTRGMVLTYDGEPIEAYYHSTCGGRTAALEEVWPGEPRPYLKSVSDATPDGGAYCETSNRFRWTEHWDGPALRAALERELTARTGSPVQVNEISVLAVTGRTTSGRTEAVRVVVDGREHRVRGDSVRWLLRPEPNRILNSSLIQLQPEGVDEITGLTVEGGGWGHGIGMCQVGAMGRARAGQSYRDILLTYYPGTTITRLYR